MSAITKVSEAHKELYHYTTAAGLEGILRAQQLWATHMGYLNDAEEHAGFFIRRLPTLLDAPSTEAVAELESTDEGRRAIKELGGTKRATEEFRRTLADVVRAVTLDFNEPYIVSFCSGTVHPHPTDNDGLLSQWRGYGTDGGYAIVFDTAQLEQIVEKEVSAFEYQFRIFSDVDYDFPEGTSKSSHPERAEWEKNIHGEFKDFILSRGQRHQEKLYNSISALSSRYKHYGFSEEKEVRIVVVPIHDKVHQVDVEHAQKEGRILKPRKPIKFRERRGSLMPYLELFGGTINGSTGKLPIQRILVGPHVDKEKRAAAVRALVKQCSMNVPVQVSGIPYLGQ